MKFPQFRALCRESAFVNIRFAGKDVMAAYSADVSTATEACFYVPGHSEIFDYMVTKKDLEKAVISKGILKVRILFTGWMAPAGGTEVRRGDRGYRAFDAELRFLRLAAINPAKFIKKAA